MSLSDGERVLVEAIARGRDDLVALASELIRFDTTTYQSGDPPRDEAALQHYLAGRLSALGAQTEVWEPRPESLVGNPLVPAELRFNGRPQMLARFAGTGGGRSLLLNGHIDVISTEPRSAWVSDPNGAEVRDGKLYGRGSADMKGGIAAMVYAAETLARLGVRLAGDLLICTVTDEETTGAGGAAAVVHGVRADAAIVTEATNFDVWVACRGSLIPTVTVTGRAGHAGFPQPHWSAGGAVNAIEKMQIVMDAMRRLQTEWQAHPNQRHPYLSPGEIVPTQIVGGEWVVSYPASCSLTYHVEYLPGHADADGWGSTVAREIEECIAQAARTDPWLAQHPPTVAWAPESPSAEVSLDQPIVSVALGAAAEVGRPSRIAGMDNWHDGATFTRLGATPAICLGPGSQDQTHTVDEYVPVDDLVDCAQAIALAICRFCG